MRFGDDCVGDEDDAGLAVLGVAEGGVLGGGNGLACDDVRRWATSWRRGESILHEKLRKQVCMLERKGGFP